MNAFWGGAGWVIFVVVVVLSWWPCLGTRLANGRARKRLEILFGQVYLASSRLNNALDRNDRAEAVAALVELRELELELCGQSQFFEFTAACCGFSVEECHAATESR